MTAISSSWTKHGSTISYKVTIPANATATVHLPVVAGVQPFLDGRVVTGTPVKLQSGAYEFEWK
jgi:hypothetical protein